METFEAFDEEYNETIAILQVTKSFSKIYIKNTVNPRLEVDLVLFYILISLDLY